MRRADRPKIRNHGHEDPFARHRLCGTARLCARSRLRPGRSLPRRARKSCVARRRPKRPAGERAAALDRAEDRRTGGSASRDRRHPRKKRRYARHYRRYAYWEPFPVYWPNYYHHRLNWRRVAWFNWF